jgi:hypothetical protein
MDADWNSVSAQLHGSFLDQQIRRTNRNLLVVSVLLIAGVAVYGFAQWRYFYNFFSGPLEVNSQSLNNIQHPDGQLRYFVKVRADDASDSGIQEIERETENGSVRSETVKAKYSILTVGKRLLIAKTDPNAKGNIFQGGLSELPGDVRGSIVEPLLKDYPNANEVFLPLMLDATGFRSNGYIALAICIPALLLAFWLIRKVVSRRNAPETHPIVKAASYYGSLGETSQLLDNELRGNVTKFGSAKVTQSWVLLPETFGLAMCHIPNLIWAYKKVTQHRTNFIPTGKSYAVILYDRRGKPVQLQTKQKNVEALLNLLAERAPWAVFGYNEELNKALRTNWAGFVAAVDAKRSGPASAT